MILCGQHEFITDNDSLANLRSKFKNINYYKPVPKFESVFDRYINGEYYLLDSINSQLRSNSLELKKSLLSNMLERPFDFQFPTELQKVIINNFSIGEINFIWVIGKYKFNEYVNFFEKQLHLLDSEQQANILYWLGEDGSSLKGFQLLKRLLNSKDVDFYSNSRLLDALYNYMQSKDLQIRDDAIELAIEMYYSKTIYKQFLEYSEYDAKNFEDRHLYELLSSGDPKIITIAKSLYQQKKNEEIALSALLRNDCIGYKEELINRIINDGEYDYVGRNASVDYLKSCSDYSIIPLIIEKYFNKRIKQCVNFFESNHLLSELSSSLNLIQDEDITQILKNEIRIKKRTASEVVQDLFNIGVISELDTASFTNKVLVYQNSNKYEYKGITSMISPYIYFLFDSPINTRFDWESNEFPIQYEEILYNALNLSTKDIGIPKIYSVVEVASDMSYANHEIFIDFSEFGIITQHRSNSLYPDTKFIISILNLCNSLNPKQKRFYHEFISESNIIFYANESTFIEYSNYLKNACN